jgi:hypothetical protein
MVLQNDIAFFFVPFQDLVAGIGKLSPEGIANGISYLIVVCKAAGKMAGNVSLVVILLDILPGCA